MSCKVKGSRDFVLGEMLADLGCVNIADSDESLLEDLSLEAIIAAEPDYIFVVLQGSDPTDAMETLEQTLLAKSGVVGAPGRARGAILHPRARALQPEAQRPLGGGI